jgi:predicted nucleic acid-binding protein
LIVLDTNVLSALMSDHPSAAPIRAWANACSEAELFTTSINLFEIERGIATTPEGRRRESLAEAFRRTLEAGLGDRILVFDAAAARAAAALEGRRKQRGVVIDMRDTMIAGILIANEAAIATRNVKDFADCGVPVHEPWLT